MGLRRTVFILAFLALFSSLVGAYFSYTKLKFSVRSQIDHLTTKKLNRIKARFSSFLAEQSNPVRILAGLEDIQEAFVSPSPKTLFRANNILDHFKITLGVDVCYLMNKQGETIASSNRGDPDSFVGKNFSFRPYFKQAIRGVPFTYLALGTTSGKRGIYYSAPVFDSSKREPIGVAVIKAPISTLEIEFSRNVSKPDNLLLVDPHGIIFLTTKADWLFHSLWPLNNQQKQTLLVSRQFGTGPWPWIGLYPKARSRFVDPQGKEFLIYREEIEELPGWSLVYLRRTPGLFSQTILLALRTTGALTFPLFFLIGLTVFFLYRRASKEIVQRKNVEEALKESEERYRTLYMKTPALLHSIDPSGRIVSVSDYWLEALGYTRDEVLGKKITDFMTPSSREYAEKEIIPRFLARGYCKDVHYQFLKKDGEIIEVLLSAIAERDKEGKILRSLAILVDITKLKKIEKELKKATQELSRYSQDLERQVEKRTQELRKLSAKILESQEQERALLARELHDELGQLLTALRMDAVWIYDKLRKQSPSRLMATAKDMCELIDKMIDEVRSLAVHLRPGVLDDLGLIPAIEWLLEEFEKRSGVSCTFRYETIPQVSETVATALYRITQEALTNIGRHAQASRVEISLLKEEEDLVLTILDDGIGFGLSQLEADKGLGITGMKERASLLGAKLKIVSTPGQGTKIELRLSLKSLL